MSVINSEKRETKTITRANAKEPKQRKPKHCPICNTEMGRCTEANRDTYYCTECDVYVKNGTITTANLNGEFEKPLAHLKVVRSEQPDPPLEPKDFDIYFQQGVKKGFRGLIGREPVGNWIKLTKADGKEIWVNSDNVNYLEEI